MRDGKIVALKLACETDFVAKNENFQALFTNIFDQIAQQTHEVAEISDLDPAMYEKVNADVQEFMGKTGENMKIGAVLVTTKK